MLQRRLRPHPERPQQLRRLLRRERRLPDGRRRQRVRLLRQRAVSGDVTGVADLPRLGLDLVGGEGFVRGILSSFNLFTIWWLVILVYGLAVLSGRSPRQAMPAALVAGCVWLLLTGMLAGLAFLSPGS